MRQFSKMICAVSEACCPSSFLDAGDDNPAFRSAPGSRRCLLPAALSVTDEDDRHLRMLAGGDEPFHAVQHGGRRPAWRVGGDRRGVGAGVRPGQAEAAEHNRRGRAASGISPFCSSLPYFIVMPQASEFCTLTMVGWRHRRRRSPASAPGHVVHAGTVPFLGHGDAHGAEGAEFPQRLGREGVVAVPFAGRGRRSCR